MTYEELNTVRNLKKQISAGQAKVKALRESAESITTKYTRVNTKNGSYTALDISPKSKNNESKVELLAALIVDTESEISTLQKRLTEEIPKLTKKIQALVTDNTEQTLMIYRYVACKFFRDIGFLMGYSENWVYWKHTQILKKIVVD